ncbi:MAG TPA: Veg protein [Clostridia bacterium]|nr:Veg protein [Clostridia bacterium]
MAAKEVLASIKNTLDDCVGQRIKLKANKGRKKVYERTGVLEQTYPHIFVIKLDEHHSVVRRVSFSYTDVLTETVELTVYRGGKEQKIKAVKS